MVEGALNHYFALRVGVEYLSARPGGTPAAASAGGAPPASLVGVVFLPRIETLSRAECCAAVQAAASAGAALAAGTAGWMQPCTTGGTFTTLVDPGTPFAVAVDNSLAEEVLREGWSPSDRN